MTSKSVRAVQRIILSHGIEKDFGSEDERASEGGVAIMQTPDEMAMLISFLLRKNRKYENYLEIGAYKGGFTYNMDHFFKPENIAIVDYNETVVEDRKRVLGGLRYKECIANSHSEKAIQFVANFGLLFDLIVIDAEHTYDGAKQDTLNYLPFLKDGGYIVFHDVIYWDGVRKWAQELSAGAVPGLVYERTFRSVQGRVIGIGVYRKTVNGRLARFHKMRARFLQLCGK